MASVAPPGYTQIQSGWWQCDADGSGPYFLTPAGLMLNPLTTVQILNGVIRPTIWKRVATGALLTPATLWTPAAGKAVRLLGYMLYSGILGGLVTLRFNTTAFLDVPTLVLGTIVQDGWNGGPIGAADQSLTVAGAVTQTLSGYVYGTEE